MPQLRAGTRLCAGGREKLSPTVRSGGLALQPRLAHAPSSPTNDVYVHVADQAALNSRIEELPSPSRCWRQRMSVFRLEAHGFALGRSKSRSAFVCIMDFRSSRLRGSASWARTSSASNSQG